jgi:hypothetical protein
VEEAVPERFRPVIAAVVAGIAAGEFERIQRDGFIRSPAPDNDFAMWVREYPATLVPLPDEAWAAEYANVVPLEDGTGWSVALDLWSREEGRSDLTLEGTLHDTERGPRLLIDNIHVL